MRQTRVAIGLKRLFAKSKWQTRDTPLDYGDYYFLEALLRFKALAGK